MAIRKPLLIQLLKSIKCCISTTLILSLILIILGLLCNLTYHERLESFTMFLYLFFLCLYICYTVIPPSILFVILLYHLRIYYYGLITLEIIVFINLLYFLSFILLMYFPVKGVSLMMLFYVGTAMFNIILLLLFQLILKKTNNKKFIRIKQVCDRIRFHHSYLVNKKIDSTLISIITLIIISLIICNINLILSQ